MNNLDKKIEILVVDDNRNDSRLIEIYFDDERMIPHNLNIVNNGLEAMKLLERKDKYHDYPKPDIILLDLYMPLMDGREVLKSIRSNDNYKNIVVCIMTSSLSEANDLNLEAIPATFYILKPVDVDKFLELIDKAITYLPDEWQSILS